MQQDRVGTQNCWAKTHDPTLSTSVKRNGSPPAGSSLPEAPRKTHNLKASSSPERTFDPNHSQSICFLQARTASSLPQQNYDGYRYSSCRYYQAAQKNTTESAIKM
jgi:hypothetical protein